MSYGSWAGQMGTLVLLSRYGATAGCLIGGLVVHIAARRVREFAEESARVAWVGLTRRACGIEWVKTRSRCSREYHLL